MRRAMTAGWLLGLLGALPLAAQETAPRQAVLLSLVDGSLPETVLSPPAPAPIADPPCFVEATSWQTVWGLVGLRAIPDGLKTAPNGVEYHQNFTLDCDLNLWLWRSQGLYMYADMRLWGEKGESGVTNSRDGAVGTSKREFDLCGGAAWNYAGSWELRGFGYTDNNLNRGVSTVTPNGFTDGFGLENRYYLSPEYAKLGQTGYDVAKSNFVSFGYYPSKVMVGNNGQTFKPGMMLRAYLTYDLWNWPCYLYGDATYISEDSFKPRLLEFDVGLSVRPFRACQQWEFRLGTENTADFQSHDVQSSLYASVQFIF